jgi:hypothetical protein
MNKKQFINDECVETWTYAHFFCHHQLNFFEQSMRQKMCCQNAKKRLIQSLICKNHAVCQLLDDQI